MAYLLVDDRERAVITHLRTRAPDSITASPAQPAQPATWEVARLGNGDYSVVTRAEPHQTLAIFERKTYSDFASSIKDGRVDNIARLVALRDSAPEPRARVGIILEGHPSRGCSTIDGIPIANIRAKLDHLWMRDDVYLMETRDEQDTAARLLAFVAHTTSLLAKLKHAPAPIQGGVPLAAQKVAPPTARDDVIAMYSVIPTIGPTKARALVDSGASLAEYIAQPNTPYTKHHTPDLDRAILAAITRMTPSRASALLEFAHGDLSALFAMDAAAIDAFTINGKRAHALTARVMDCAHFAAMPQ
jgi:ERCC4-type nuclease